jgi:hypothetical protein
MRGVACHIRSMTQSRPRRPRDPNQLAKQIIDIATGEIGDTDSASVIDPTKNPHAVELGRLGGKKGGPARAKTLSAEERSEIAKNAARHRWAKR